MPLRSALFSIVGRIRSSFLGGLLVVALGVTGVVTYHAYSASKEYKAIVERVLNDYVTFASYQINNSTRITLYDCARAWFRPIIAGNEQPGAMAAIRSNECGSNASGRFELDLGKGLTAAVTTGKLPDGALKWLQDTVPSHPRLPFDDYHSVGVLSYETPVGPELIVYVADLRGSVATHVVGFVAEGALPWIVEGTLAASHMLPPELTNGAPDSSYFQVEASSGPKRTAFQKLPRYAEITGLGTEFGSIALKVALKPLAIRRIVPEGIPQDRGWELIGLLGLAAGLVLSSLLLLQRESQLARLREGFVDSVSHELRTPLTQIRMFAEMLLLGRVRNEADRRRSLEIIDKEARRLSQLVENVLQVARSERGAVRVNPIEATVAPIVRDAVEGFLVLAESRQIEFRLELQDDLVAPVDAAAVKQIMVNLLDNAAKYGPAGQRVVVGLALFDGAARLWVDDEGPGVPARERERVFEAFYRATRDFDSSTTGSGIGLAVVRELATLHGGSAWIEATPQSSGARVVVEFPGARIAAEVPVTDWAVA